MTDSTHKQHWTLSNYINGIRLQATAEHIIMSNKPEEKGTETGVQLDYNRPAKSGGAVNLKK